MLTIKRLRWFHRQKVIYGTLNSKLLLRTSWNNGRKTSVFVTVKVGYIGEEEIT